MSFSKTTKTKFELKNNPNKEKVNSKYPLQKFILLIQLIVG